MVDGRHGSGPLRAAQRLGLATELVLAHDVAELGVCYGLCDIIWQDSVGDTLSGIVSMTVSDAVQHAFDVFGVDSPSSHPRSGLEAWLTAERADPNVWTNWSFINLLTLVMLSPEMSLA